MISTFDGLKGFSGVKALKAFSRKVHKLDKVFKKNHGMFESLENSFKKKSQTSQILNMSKVCVLKHF